jgi:hypothetical protein
MAFPREFKIRNSLIFNLEIPNNFVVNQRQRRAWRQSVRTREFPGRARAGGILCKAGLQSRGTASIRSTACKARKRMVSGTVT